MRVARPGRLAAHDREDLDWFVDREDLAVVSEAASRAPGTRRYLDVTPG